MSRFLVTGGAGFIGSHVVHHLLDTRPDADIVVVDKLTYAGDPGNLPDDPRVRLVVGDVCDSPLVHNAMTGIDVVVHLAAESHVDRSIAGAAEFVRTNVDGTATVLDAALAHGVRKVVHVSTDEVYGSIAEGSWAEDRPLAPSSPYSASKAGSDLLALAYHRTHGLPVCVTRCSNNYGPRQFPEKVIPLFVTRLMDGLRVPLYNDGSNVRDWLHVSDHCRALDVVIDAGRPGEIYNIGGGTELSNRSLTALLLDAFGADWSMVEHVTDRPGHDQRYSVDDTRIRELGYRPQVGITLGLAETVHWYRDHRSWWEPRTYSTTGAA